MKKKIAAIVKSRKKNYHEHVIQKLMADTTGRSFFHHVVMLLGQNHKPQWPPRMMYEGKSDLETVELLAAYYNNISSQYDPLPEQIEWGSSDRTLPVLSEEDVQKKLLAAKKPLSTVPGDINPRLCNMFSQGLARPITTIFNSITAGKEWPRPWSVEHVTVILKN